MILNKKTIIAIVGRSGSGKSYIANMLDKYYDIPMIESRTTRPRRKPDEAGHTFVTEEEYDTYREEDMIAPATFGGYRYCSLLEDIKYGYNTYIVTEDGLSYLRDNFSSRFNIFSVKIETPKHIRLAKVGQERIDRDEGKFTMPRDEFDYVINNYHDDRTNRKVTKLVLRIQQKFN